MPRLPSARRSERMPCSAEAKIQITWVPSVAVTARTAVKCCRPGIRRSTETARAKTNSQLRFRKETRLGSVSSRMLR